MLTKKVDLLRLSLPKKFRTKRSRRFNTVEQIVSLVVAWINLTTEFKSQKQDTALLPST